MLLLFFVLFFSREKILECIQKYAILKIIWIYMYVCVCVCVCVYVCVCIYIYIFIGNIHTSVKYANALE